MFLAMLDHVQASLLRKARNFAELHSSISLPHHLRQREMDLQGNISVLFFYFWEGTRMVTNTFLRMCWLMKSVRNLIFGGQSDRLGRSSRQQLWTHWKDDGRKPWIFLSPQEVPRPQCRRKKWKVSCESSPVWLQCAKINEIRVTCLFLLFLYLISCS